MELAAALLEVTHEGQFDRFLANVATSTGAPDAPSTHLLGGLLKDAAKKALPFLAPGALAPGEGVGRVSGRSVASTAGEAFGLELEGLSNEDEEFEAAKAFIRLAAAARSVASNPHDGSPDAAARRSLYAAATRYAPGLPL